MAYGAVSFSSLLRFFMSTNIVLDHTSKAAGKWFTSLYDYSSHLVITFLSQSPHIPTRRDSGPKVHYVCHLARSRKRF
jgi:hypothetical protein